MLNLRLGCVEDIPRLQELMAKSGVEIPGMKYDDFSDVVIVAEIGSDIVGFVQFLLGKPYTHITEMSVDPDYRGQHIGRTLMAAVESTMREVGSPAWTTVTSKDYIADALLDWGAEYVGMVKGFVRTLDANC